MRRVITALSGLALAGGTFIFASSCYKEQDWNCVCKDNQGQESTDLIRDKTRKEAKAECDSKINVLGYERECKLSLF
ncbi:MAG: hypothetical protein BGO31_12240 [Bacteroidetes bacterium 43-16]|nr:MAG: hypothetical protein BGO31_12240 [Bacteroidetes bacterium 43-16]